MANTSFDNTVIIQSYRCRHEEFAASHLPLRRIDLTIVNEWARDEESGIGSALYFLIHVNPQETLRTKKNYWVFVMADVMHQKNDPFAPGELWTRALDVTQAYRRGFRGVIEEGAKVDERGAANSSDFEKGRLYQAADEAARTGNSEVLEKLVLKTCRTAAEKIGMRL